MSIYKCLFVRKNFNKDLYFTKNLLTQDDNHIYFTHLSFTKKQGLDWFPIYLSQIWSLL